MKQILWQEGLFLRPQHFQQQDQFWQERFATCFDLKNNFSWGLTAFALHRNLLSKGEISIKRLEGITPDGTVFMLSGQEQDLSIRLDKTAEPGLLYLVLPKTNTEGVNVALTETESNHKRYILRKIEAQDQLKAEQDRIEIDILQPNFYLACASDPAQLDTAIILPLLQILEVRDNGEIILDESFIAPLLRLSVHDQLLAYVKEIAGLLSLRRMKLLDRMGGVDHYGVAGISELLLLQLINRYEPLLEHYRQQNHLHPESVYQLFLQLAGELRTFTSKDRSYAKPPLYQHDNLRATFQTLMQDLRAAFNYVFDEPAILINFTSYKYHLYLATFHDRVHFDYQRLVLAVRADMPLEQLQNLFPAHAKLGPTEQIKDLVNLQIPGIPLSLLPVAPRQIPYHTGFVYFELDNRAEMWLKLKESSALALHLSGNFPNVEMKLWAIKS
jgi:type VI secretion system protein ImpJ